MSAGLSGPGAKLLANLVGANVDSLARTTDSIIKTTEAQRDSMAEDYIRLYDALEKIPDMVRPVFIERQLSLGAHARDVAERYVNGYGSN